ncbi:hypothetical protein K1719_000466 [Acacia pycnantha]|nr:hypothetical protein K1719_000466 [Acacia pycnantha]
MKEASQTDSSIVVQPPACPPRHQKWKAARMKGGKPNEDIKTMFAEGLKTKSPDLEDEITSHGNDNKVKNLEELDPMIRNIVLLGDTYGVDGELGIILRKEPFGAGVLEPWKEGQQSKPNSQWKVLSGKLEKYVGKNLLKIFTSLARQNA